MLGEQGDWHDVGVAALQTEIATQSFKFQKRKRNEKWSEKFDKIVVNHFSLTSARLSAPDPKTRPSYLRTQATSELHPNHIRNNGRS